MGYEPKKLDDAWTIVLNMKNKLYMEKIKIAERTRTMEAILLPVLQILEKHDIPVRKVWWETYAHSVDLKDEVALTKDAALEISEALDAHCNTSFYSGVITTVFSNDKGDIDIVSGRNTCTLKKITEEVPVPAKTEKRVRYEMVGDCSTYSGLKEVENG